MSLEVASRRAAGAGPTLVPAGLLLGAAVSGFLAPNLVWPLIGLAAGHSLSGST